MKKGLENKIKKETSRRVEKIKRFKKRIID